MALVWKAVTRAQVSSRSPVDVNTKVALMHSVNLRNRIESPLPNRYLGNANAVQRLNEATVGCMLQDDSLSSLASAIRSSIKRVTTEYAAELSELMAGLEDNRWIQLNIDHLIGMDLAGSSWQEWSAYTKHDFGFGVPQSSPLIRSSFWKSRHCAAQSSLLQRW